MRFIFSVVFAVLTAASVQAQSQEDLQKQIASLQERLAKFSTSETYTAGCAESLKTGKRLVTFIGIAPRAVPGSVVARCNWLDGYDAPKIVLSVPGRGFLDELAVLPATATDAEIQAAMMPRAVQALPAPFVLGKAADGNIPPTVVGEVCDALAAVNATRAQRGLRAYLRDDGLTAGALRIAAHRAERRMYGHTAKRLVAAPALLPIGAGWPARPMRTGPIAEPRGFSEATGASTAMPSIARIFSEHV